MARTTMPSAGKKPLLIGQDHHFDIIRQHLDKEIVDEKSNAKARSRSTTRWLGASQFLHRQVKDSPL